jgi:hypothetical protein
MDSAMTDEDRNKLVRSVEEAAAAWVRGDMGRYLDLVHHAPGFTRLAPNGGPASRHENRAAEFSGRISPFADGEARLEHVGTHAWGDTIVLAMIERQHGGSVSGRTRTCRYGSPTSTGATARTGSWCIAIPTYS